MKETKRLLFSIFLAVIIFSTSALAGEVDLKVNDVGLGTSYETVVKNLGKPVKSKKIRQILECSDNEPYTQLTLTYSGTRQAHQPLQRDNEPYTQLTLTYPGLIIELWNIENTRKFNVLSIRFTAGSKWAVSGLKISATQKDTIARFGKPNDSTKPRLSYVNKDNNGFAQFKFKGGKLVSVEWESAIC